MKIAKESLGVVLIIRLNNYIINSGWNNPLLSSINCLVSSILCGNTVIIKPSPFTPLSAKNFQDAFEYCGIQNIVIYIYIYI
jgi:acyl-CoA reductase-like NAD-dependent aldehyde dehydrogenase